MAASLAYDADGLLSLLKAKKPEDVDRVLGDAFRFRREALSARRREAWAASLGGLSAEEVDALAASAAGLVRRALYSGADDALPNGFHADLGGLLTKILAARLPEWRQAAALGRVCPPKMVDFDWRVDMKTASNHMSRMAVPTAIVEVKLQQPPTQAGVMPDTRDVQFELSKESLATMLDGLGKIRDQLGSMK